MATAEESENGKYFRFLTVDIFRGEAFVRPIPHSGVFDISTWQ